MEGLTVRETEVEKVWDKLGALKENGMEDGNLGSRRPVIKTGASSRSTPDVGRRFLLPIAWSRDPSRAGQMRSACLERWMCGKGLKESSDR